MRGAQVWFAVAALAGGLAAAPAKAAASFPQGEGDVVLHDFAFADGNHLPDLALHYETLGTPKRDDAGAITNAVMLLHGTTGTGRQFLIPADKDMLFAPGKPLDATRFFLILPDGIGAGRSAKPSDGLKSRFPHYGYGDQVEAQRRLLEALGVRHLALLLGTSMGGMQAWLWAERHPDMADGVVAIAATPAPIAGRNMMWRAMVIDAIKADPGFHGGDYMVEPHGWQAVLPIFAIMTGNAAHLQTEAPTRDAAVVLDDHLVSEGVKIDADDYLATFESSWDYDPSGALQRITVPLLAINFGDDLLNPPELDATGSAMAQVANGRSVLIPAGAATFGHQTLNHPEAWVATLASFMATLPRR